MPRRGSRRRNRTRKNKGLSPASLAGYGAAIALGVGGLGFTAINAIGKPVPEKNGCFVTPRQDHTLILVDASEPRWNAHQQRSIRNALDQVYEGLGFNERLSVFTSEEDQIGSAAKITPRFSVCGTARAPEELESIGAESASEGYLRRTKERLYDKFLGPELDALLTLSPESDRRQRYQSPVLELLQAISRRPEAQHARKLIVISDLLQNSDTAQFCTVRMAMPYFEVFRQRRSYARLTPEGFDGIDVELYLLQRQGFGGPALPYCRDEEELVRFYSDYFTHHGARSVTLTRLRDGNVG